MSTSYDYGSAAQQQENRRQKAITQGTASINSAFSGFNPQFYNQRQQAYVDYALPQLAQQYQTNRNQVGFNLANRGLLGGSAAQSQLSQLNLANKQGAQNISDSGLAQAQQLQQQIEGQKNQLLGQLYQSADPSGAAASATSTAAGFAQPSVFQPLANQFGNIANAYYLSQLVNAYRPTSYVSVPDSGGSALAPIGSPAYSVSQGAGVGVGGGY